MKICSVGHGEYSQRICPKCQKIYRKKYYEQNKIKEKAQTREWIEANRDHVKAYKQEYNETNRDIQSGWYKNRLAKRKYDSIWRGMIERCTNPKHHKYSSYGTRGIKVFEGWFGVETGYFEFERYMGDRPSIQHTVDRINTNGNYEPGNVKWSTKKQQQRNRRVNAIVEINGRSQCVSAWAEEIGIRRSTFQRRLDLEWAGSRLLQPPDQKFNRLAPRGK